MWCAHIPKTQLSYLYIFLLINTNAIVLTFPHRGTLNAFVCCVRSHCRESSRCSVEAKGSGRVSVRQRGSPSGWASHRHPAAQYRTNHLICQQRPSSSLLPDPASKRNPRGEVGSWQAYSTCTQTHSLYGYIQYTCWIILSNKESLRMLCSLKCEIAGAEMLAEMTVFTECLSAVSQYLYTHAHMTGIWF